MMTHTPGDPVVVVSRLALPMRPTMTRMTNMRPKIILPSFLLDSLLLCVTR